MQQQESVTWSVYGIRVASQPFCVDQLNPAGLISVRATLPIYFIDQSPACSTCILITQFKTVLKISQLTQTVTVLLRFAMIWLKVKIPIPKLVVTIYRLSFLWPL